MRFSRFPRAERREATPRRLAAAARAIRRQKDAVALFPELYAGPETADERVEAAEDGAVRWWTGLRDHHARTWREARAALRALPPITRAGLLRYWNRWGGPLDAAYFAEMVREARAGVSYWRKLATIRRFSLAGAERDAVKRARLIQAIADAEKALR